MYKEDLLIQSRALAVALATEWEAQVETIDMREMYLNNMMAKAITTLYDPSTKNYMLREAEKIFENDNLCFTEPGEGHSNFSGATEYQQKLRQR